jgi:RNA polymerase sigma-70 factor (ECF subfamily)
MSEFSAGREFWRNLKQQIARRTNNSAEAEDLLHSAFVKFHDYQLQHEVANPAAFIIKTACNLRIDNLRRQKKTVDVTLAEGVEDKLPLQDEVVTSRERLKRVQAGLDRLPPKTRTIFMMHRWHELEYQEIADRLEISVSSVEKHMARALLFLSDWADGW